MDYQTGQAESAPQDGAEGAQTGMYAEGLHVLDQDAEGVEMVVVGTLDGEPYRTRAEGVAD